MTEPEEHVELTEPHVTDVPEPDQEPSDDNAAEEEAAEAEPEPEPEATAVDDREIERQFKALLKERDRHANRIGEIMGEDAQFLETCPRCTTSDPQRPATPGFIWPVSMVPLLPDDKAAVKLSIGEGVEPEFVQAQDASRCPQCNGRGKVKTDSLVQGQERLKCLDCMGRGWIGSRQYKSEAPPMNDVPEFVSVGAGAEEAAPDKDPWGRLRDDPLFGVMPGFERD